MHTQYNRYLFLSLDLYPRLSSLPRNVHLGHALGPDAEMPQGNSAPTHVLRPT